MAKKKDDVEEKGNVKEEGEEAEEKSSGLLSDDALEAFDDASPTGLEEEELVAGEDDELDDFDFRTSDEW